jgi:hypothetical protein
LSRVNFISFADFSGSRGDIVYFLFSQKRKGDSVEIANGISGVCMLG